jgi:molybdenum cofactor biosynthesis enzyme MoaA
VSLEWTTVRQAPERAELWLRLTRVCDERCLFCYDESAMNGTMVPFGMLHRQLREGRAAGHIDVNFTGGEPTLHPHFAKVVRLAKLLGYRKVHVTTNGRRFKDAAWLAEALDAGLDSATFSIHGHTEELNDRQTRAHHSFRDSIAGLEAALACRRLAVGVHVVVSRINAPHAADILRFFRGLGVSNVNFIALVPVSAAWDHRRELFPTGEDGWRYLWDLFERSTDPELRSQASSLLARHAEYVASTARVPGYAGMLQRLMRTGEPQPCRGEKCACCPLDELCRDLESLRENGTLGARPSAPPCEDGDERPAASPLALEGATLESFVSFFLEHRLRAKGMACHGCERSGRCPGGPVGRILERGFPVPPARWVGGAA